MNTCGEVLQLMLPPLALGATFNRITFSQTDERNGYGHIK